MNTAALGTPAANDPPRRRWQGYPLGIARHSPTLAIGFLIVLLFLLLAILADVIAPFNPTRGFPYAVLRPPGGGVDASQAVEALGMFLHHVGHQLLGQVPAAGQAQEIGRAHV